MKQIQRGKLHWLIRRSSVIVHDDFQATIYHSYGMPAKGAIAELKQKVIKSNDNELSSWVDVIELTQSLGLIGYGTTLRDFSEES